MKKFYVICLIVLVIIVGVFKLVSVKDEGYEDVYLEENSVLDTDVIKVEEEKIKIHVVGEVMNPRNL